MAQGAPPHPGQQPARHQPTVQRPPQTEGLRPEPLPGKSAYLEERQRAADAKYLAFEARHAAVQRRASLTPSPLAAAMLAEQARARARARARVRARARARV